MKNKMLLLALLLSACGSANRSSSGQSHPYFKIGDCVIFEDHAEWQTDRIKKILKVGKRHYLLRFVKYEWEEYTMTTNHEYIDTAYYQIECPVVEEEPEVEKDKCKDKKK